MKTHVEIITVTKGSRNIPRVFVCPKNNMLDAMMFRAIEEAMREHPEEIHIKFTKDEKK